ncbi:14-3-3 protein homolog [Cyclospora cayetanensis]|uniref:14-3-3 protein homolog n=1 Tax=Cyclospora cayetanensis TaxID=88456 RepID=A0A6P6RZF1_9EIME|nr:14-3-3 protein homolog [Cyclospora cayetanensis]
MGEPPGTPRGLAWVAHPLRWFGSHGVSNQEESVTGPSVPLGASENATTQGPHRQHQQRLAASMTQDSSRILDSQVSQFPEGSPATEWQESGSSLQPPSSKATPRGVGSAAQKSTVRIGGKVNPGEASAAAAAGPGSLNMKYIHKFVIDMNKRAAAKQQGAPVESWAPPEGTFGPEAMTKSILVFSGIPHQELDNVISESSAMSLIRESLGATGCPSIELDCVFMASVSSACHRYKDNQDYAKTLIRSQLFQGRDLSEQEWKAVRQCIDSLLSSLASQWNRLGNMSNEADLNHPVGIRRAIQREVLAQKAEVKDKILRHCELLVAVASHCLSLPAAFSTTRIFYNQTLGTIFRFLLEFCEGVAAYQCEDLAVKHFKAAMETAQKDLPPYHTLRIDAVVSYVSFLHQQLGERQEAMEIARSAFKEVAETMDTVPEGDFVVVTKAARTLLRLINSWSEDSKRVLISTASVF